MISASKITLSLNNLKILRPKVTKILGICVRRFVNPHPVSHDTHIGHEIFLPNASKSLILHLDMLPNFS